MSFQKILVCHYFILELRIVGIFEKCFFSCLGILCLLMLELMRNALFFFLVRHFSILELSIFQFFGDIQKRCFFQMFRHFVSTHVWVDVECPDFLLVRHFSILGLSIFSIFLEYSKVFCFFSCLGILCPLVFEWMRNALIFFWSHIFLFWDSVFFQFLWDIPKCSFFQLFGHFVSTQVWVDAECPTFFLVRHFSILGLSIFSIFWGYSKFFFFSCLGICVYS